MKIHATKIRLLVLGVATMLVAACGQKGPLYLPDPTQKQIEQYEAEKEKQDKKEENQDNKN